MAGILSKGLELHYKSGGEFVKLTNLQEIPSLGGSVEKVETTTLDDASKHYIKGLKDYGDLAFKFIYEDTQFSTLDALAGVQDWKVVIPDGTGSSTKTATFSGECSVSLEGAGTNVALTYTLNIALSTDITFA